MSRITMLKIGEKEYPLNFSLKAAKILSERYGGLEKIDTAFQDKGTSEMMDETLFILCTLIEQGIAYEKIFNGKEYPSITLNDMEILLGISELKSLKSKIMEAMTAGMKREVEIEIDPNEKTIQSK